MSQPQPCVHEMASDSMICERCGQTAERVVDMPAQFGTCWREVVRQFSDCEALAYRGPIPWRTR